MGWSAAIAFTDGVRIGATLDRNGLRPARYIVTDDDMVVMASEVGVLPIPESRITKKWRLQPGKMFLIDTEQGRIIDDAELKQQPASSKPAGRAATREQALTTYPRAKAGFGGESRRPARSSAGIQVHAGRRTPADAADGNRCRGSSRLDGQRHGVAGAFRSRQTAIHYFKQLFAQVTNPPIDPIREQLVMSLVSFIAQTKPA